MLLNHRFVVEKRSYAIPLVPPSIENTKVIPPSPFVSGMEGMLARYTLVPGMQLVHPPPDVSTPPPMPIIPNPPPPSEPCQVVIWLNRLVRPLVKTPPHCISHISMCQIAPRICSKPALSEPIHSPLVHVFVPGRTVTPVPLAANCPST